MNNVTLDEKAIFLKALELTSVDKRDAYLNASCAGNPALRAQVDDLLAAHGRPVGWLDVAEAAAPAADPAPLHQEPGSLIGPYKLLEVIGEGGMGVVYIAEQTAPIRRKVALKIIKPGMDTRQVVARFEAERQALALMDHPHIARVLDAGATLSGHPYFVMELVRGVPITSFCDSQRLSVRDRLDLFVSVCQAVQHAHQKGVIHRDLKPPNVLVTLHDGVPVPKVIDFGVAKATGVALTDATLFTAFTQLIGTPLYMSPEQAELSGLDVDTRSDIYSLGVLLYELLTGTTPFVAAPQQQGALEELRRLIREEEPPTPSTRLRTLGGSSSAVSTNRGTDCRRLTGAVRGELDWIVMKCLEKDRTRRYETANALARDVLRYLEGQAVEAGPPSSWYRLRRLARRHRVALTTTSLVALSLVAGTAVSLGQARASERESLLQQILRTLSIDHTAGWWKEVETQVAEAGRLGPDDDHRVQGYAAAALAGLDAGLVGTIPLQTTALAFDPTGRRLYLRDSQGQPWIWDESANPHRKVGTAGIGPFAFRAPNGQAVQLVLDSADGSPVMELRTLESTQAVQRYSSPLGPGSSFEAPALTPDASFVAAMIRRPNGRDLAVVWSAGTGAVVRQVEVVGASCLGLTPDGSWLAVGTEEGEVVVWPLPGGDPLPAMSVGRVAVSALTFGEDRLRRLRPGRAGDGWLLGVGDVATGLAVFELGTQSTRCRCLGSNYEVRSIAFGPDGMLLASAGRAEPLLWDLATGLPLLRLPDINGASSLVFSPDGKRIAVGTEPSFGEPLGVVVHELENGRGLQTLRGLDAQIQESMFSADGRLVAALAQDFSVGLWDRVANRLLHVLEVPIGRFADQAGMSFSPDGRRFAYSAGTRAKIWSVETGELLETWELADGSLDRLAFLDADQLVSVRLESRNARRPNRAARELGPGPSPGSPRPADAAKDPASVIRVRVFGPEPGSIRELAEVSDFDLGVFTSQLSFDGRSLLIEGLTGPRHAPRRLLKAFDLAANRELWSFEGARPDIDTAVVHFDPTGRVFWRRNIGTGRLDILEFSTRALLESYEAGDPRNADTRLAPDGVRRLTTYSRHGSNGYCLWATPEPRPLLVVPDIRSNSARIPDQFSLDGSFAVMGNVDGTVTILELAEVRDRLAAFGLDR